MCMIVCVHALHNTDLSYLIKLSRSYQSMDSLQDIGCVGFIMVGILVGLVSLLQLEEKGIQNSW